MVRARQPERVWARPDHLLSLALRAVLARKPEHSGTARRSRTGCCPCHWTMCGADCAALMTATGRWWRSCLAFANQSAWKIYTNNNRAFSFSYPKSWGEPRVLENQKSNEFQVDFGNYEFSVNNGYYFGDINGKRPTVSQPIQGYKDDMDSKNEVKYFQTENIEVDSRRAIKPKFLQPN